MKPVYASGWTCPRSIILMLGPLMALPVVSADSFAIDKITRIEEDWQLRIQTPNANEGLPAITHVISPTSSLESEHTIVLFNYVDFPKFHKGGMQIQSWNGDDLIGARDHPKTGVLSVVNENLKYTIAMEIVSGNLVVEILNGRSTTWGNFGGEGYLKITRPTTLTSLNGYSPLWSVANADVRGGHNLSIGALVKTTFYSGKKSVGINKTTKNMHLFKPRIQDVSLEDYLRNPDAYSFKVKGQK